MNALAKRTADPDDDDLTALTLEQLFATAMAFGHVCLYQMDSGKFYFKIKFGTIPGTQLEALSECNHATIEGAIIEAIVRAREVRAHFKE